MANIILHRLDSQIDRAFQDCQKFWCKQFRLYRINRLACFDRDTRQARGAISDDAIGATFSFGFRDSGFGPRLSFLQDFRLNAKKALKNRNISLKAARRLAGQEEWANHFLENGSVYCISAFHCIANH